MKLTLLQIVQSVLSAMEADNVNNISDTHESVAIARVAEEVFFELISRGDWPHLETMTALIGSADSLRPTILEVPPSVKYVKAFWYNNKELKYKEPEEFIRFLNSRNSDPVDVADCHLPNGITVRVLKNKAPEFFTMFSNKYIVTDSYDHAEGATLSGSRSYITGNITPTFQTTNEFVPNLEDSMFPTYLSMVKRAAFLYLRREASLHDERAAVTGLGRLLQDKYKLYRKESKLNYGRK